MLLHLIFRLFTADILFIVVAELFHTITSIMFNSNKLKYSPWKTKSKLMFNKINLIMPTQL